MYERVGEEVRGWRNKEEKNPLWRHSEVHHDGQEFELEVKVISRSFGKPSRRLITEAVMIDELKDDETMNSKREWTFTNLNKISTAER